MDGEAMLHMGIALVVLAAVCAVIALCALRIKWSRLKRHLEEDYGPKEK